LVGTSFLSPFVENDVQGKDIKTGSQLSRLDSNHSQWQYSNKHSQTSNLRSSKYRSLTPLKLHIAPEKCWLEDQFPWEGYFSGAMLNFGRVVIKRHTQNNPHFNLSLGLSITLYGAAATHHIRFQPVGGKTESNGKQYGTSTDLYGDILLMEEILHQLIWKLIFRVSYMLGGAGFMQATVLWVGRLLKTNFLWCRFLAWSLWGW